MRPELRFTSSEYPAGEPLFEPKQSAQDGKRTIRDHVRRYPSFAPGDIGPIRRFERPYREPKRRNDMLRQVEALKRENIVVRDCEGGQLSCFLSAVSCEWHESERSGWFL
jgi:hypothetical protein